MGSQDILELGDYFKAAVFLDCFMQIFATR